MVQYGYGDNAWSFATNDYVVGSALYYVANVFGC